SEAPIESSGDAKKDAVAAAIARAKAKKAQQAESVAEAPVESSGDAKKDAVAAAIARAKAKKAQQAKQAETDETASEPEIEPLVKIKAETQQEPVDPKKAAVAAAIARAKARKAQQEQDKKNNEEKE
ncbi:electron transport complex subunit RsxC, partial [Vibrio echinoideorum]